MILPIEARCLYPEVEKMPRGELEALQLKKLKYQLEYVCRRSSFYRDLYNKAGVHPRDIQRLEDIKLLPTVTKQDLLREQKENPPYGRGLCIDPTEICMTILTSGTSGIGQETYAMSRTDMEFSGSAWAVWLHRAGIVRGDVLMLTWPLGTNSGPQAAFLGALKVGANAFPIGMYDSETKINTYLNRFNPAALLATPSYLTHLSILYQEKGIDPKETTPNLKAIFLGTESYPLSWAIEMENFWGTRLHDLYGSTQQGAMAGCTCEFGAVVSGGRGFIHLDEVGTLYEFLDRETGEPVGPGEEGELVMTNLNREGSPLIRFRSDDRVTYRHYTECRCGRTSRSLVPGAIARYDDMIKIKSQNIWPEAVDEVVFGHKEVEEYNGSVIVDERGRERVMLKIEFRKTTTMAVEERKSLLQKLAAALKVKTGVSMEIEEVPYGTLKRYLFKTRRWADERRKGLEAVKSVLGGSKEQKVG